ncbi:hypothetical protein [Salinibacter sp.]|uniref:hypothetical protein n=1 Tax=Salinibacter sp. TaxID=2065818 RepID=UPI0035D50306
MAGFSTWSLVALSLVVLAGTCSRPRTGANSPQDPDTTAVATDSAEEDSAARTGARTNQPPPHTARLRGTFRSCSFEENSGQCTIQIEEVEAYGMSTPPVASGTRTVSVRPVVRRDWTAEELVAAGTRTMTIQHLREGLRRGDEKREGSEWTLTGVSE